MLRRELAESKGHVAELLRLKKDLEAKTQTLSQLRITDAEQLAATDRVRRKGVVKGMAISAGIVAVAAIGATIWASSSWPQGLANSEMRERYLVSPSQPRPQSQVAPSIYRTAPLGPCEGHAVWVTDAELALLDRDVARLLALDPDLDSALVARARLESSHRGLVGMGLATAAKRRHAFVVPLLLRRALDGRDPWLCRMMGPVFTSLTGLPVDEHQGLDDDTAARLLRGWWLRTRESFSTDPCSLEAADRRRVLRELVAHTSLGLALSSEASRPRLPRRSSGSGLGAAGCFELADDLLSMADEPMLQYGATIMLSDLRHRGYAPQLEGVVRGSQHSSAARLVAMLAIFDAGEPMLQTELLALFAHETDRELRKAMIRAMAHCDTSVVDILIKEIEGTYRMAATDALRKFKSPAAVAPLRRVLLGTGSSRGMQDVTTLLREIDTPEAHEALAAKLERLMMLDNRPEDWGSTLQDFQRATRSTSRSRGRSVAELRQAARVAIDAWRASTGP